MLTPGLRAQMADGDFLVIRPPPSKADPFALRWGVTPMYMPYSETARICAARAMADYEVGRAPPAGQRATTPLFATGAGVPLRRNNVSKHFDAWMAAIGAARRWEPGASKQFSVHSFRVHLATAICAAGASDARIQSMLRWATVDALNCYKQTGVEEYGAWVRAAGEADVHVYRSHHLPSDKRPPMPGRPAPEAEQSAARAENLRYEADDIIGIARKGGPDGLASLMAEASMLDKEIGAHLAPDDDGEDVLLDTTF